ncbi:trichohyalin-like [Salarias fasciatus]|uniref:trichohyalin-like n=1 Tax=Salarias fasciatus TaxID=181472 RepID=UPI001176B4AF|nr:trichohyalin-like [Salarias fasciatus]
MQTEPVERRRQQGRRTGVRAGVSCVRGSGEEVERSKTHLKEEEEEEQQQTGRGAHRAAARSRRRAESEGGGCEEKTRLRWRINQLEKEKLLLKSEHNQEVCVLQAELARLRLAVEQGEAQGAELRYQLTACRRDNDSLAERLQQDQHALQQNLQERDRLLRSRGAENRRLRQRLQEQQEALQEAERRREELLQAEHQQCQSDLSAAVETLRRMTSDLEAEARGHAHTQTLLQQAVQAQQETQDVFLNVLTQISEALQPDGPAGAARHDGKPAAAEVTAQLRTTLKTYREESMLGNFTWQELCDVMSEQVEQLTSDLRAAKEEATPTAGAAGSASRKPC